MFNKNYDIFFSTAMNNKITNNKILAKYYCIKIIFFKEKGVMYDIFISIYLFNPATQVLSHSRPAEGIFAHLYQQIHSKVLPSM